MGKLIHVEIKKPVKEPLSLKEFYKKRDNILILRRFGGLGDILMHRMMFEDFKLLNPEIKITFACPKAFHEAVDDHPFIDEVIDSDTVNTSDFLTYYDTSTICGITETQNSPYSSPNRSDIWAKWCGVELTRHNMHLKVKDDDLQEAKEQIKNINKSNKPVVILSPYSAISSKNLGLDQMKGVIETLEQMGFFVFGLHYRNDDEFPRTMLIGKNIKNFIAIVAASDYIISVDSAPFHTGGGLGKPTIGIFSWADGYVYGKWYPTCEIVQLHRDTHPDWTCGPCQLPRNCTKCTNTKQKRKPCITEITSEMIINKFKTLIQRFPLQNAPT